MSIPHEHDEGAAARPHGWPVIGIGAGAGGLAALAQFFGALPGRSGWTFVVILRLPPDDLGAAVGAMASYTTLPVTAVTARTAIAPDHVYVVPPHQHLIMADGHLEVAPLTYPEEEAAPVDLFFRTLVEAHGRNAVAVVLSGAGADGAMGIQRVKEGEGLVVVQDPQEAEVDGMPLSALGTGMVDFVLPAALIPAKLSDYWRQAERVRLPDDLPPATDEEALRELFILLRRRTGHDFSQYKRATVFRRIGRRMQVTGADSLAAYLGLLRARDEEVTALLRDLLISVTNFFRDRDVWQSLQEILPQLFMGKGAGDQVRVWVAACATGEEAYSLAMLLVEYAAQLPAPPTIQIFATDIDEAAIAVARQAVYPATIAVDVSPERLRRFFTFEQTHYRVKKELRDLVLFANHNVLRDPPFSRLDLVTCRNLLIYLNRDVQEQILAAVSLHAAAERAAAAGCLGVDRRRAGAVCAG